LDAAVGRRPYETLPAAARDKIGPPIGIGTRARLDMDMESERFTKLAESTTEASFTKG
jgi:hypothetical protein